MIGVKPSFFPLVFIFKLFLVFRQQLIRIFMFDGEMMNPCFFCFVFLLRGFLLFDGIIITIIIPMHMLCTNLTII